jgi:hypothetical protein
MEDSLSRQSLKWLMGRDTMEKFLQGAFIIIGSLSFILVAGFCLRLPWTLGLWPWAASVSSLPYTFLGAIIAAIAASLLWIGFSGELGTLVGGAINLIVFYTGLTISLFLLFLQKGDQRLLIGALLCAAGVFISIGILLWVRRYPIQDKRPMPLPVRVSFSIFVAILILVGNGVLLHTPNVFAWNLSIESSMLVGWFFIGASCYFLYGLLYPTWSNACGQLWAFLAYDIVLIIPFFLRFATSSPTQLPSLAVNTVVLVYSAALAVYYFFVHKATRIWGKSREAVAASN